MEHLDYQEFFTKLDRFSGFAIINVLWVIGSAFIITLPLATVGLFAVLADWVRGKNSEALARFFGGMRQYGLKASLIALVDAGIMGLLALNLHIIPQMGLPTPIHYPFLSVTLFISLMVVMANLYIWILLVTYDLTLKRLADVAIHLSMTHFSWTFCVLLMTTGVLGLGLVFIPSGISVFVLFAGCAYVVAWGAWRVIRQYDDDLLQLSTTERVLPS